MVAEARALSGSYGNSPPAVIPGPGGTQAEPAHRRLRLMQLLHAAFAIVVNVAMQHFSGREQNKTWDADLALFKQRRKIVTKFIFAATAALFVAAPAFASEQERSFTRDGVTYIYTSTVKGDVQILEGTVQPTGENFHLVVHKGWVSGKAAGAKVSFRVPKPSRRVEVAQR